MSYDIELVDPITKQVLELEENHHMKGGTYALGGTKSASINMTYNYAKILKSVLGEKGIRSLYDISGAESINILKKAISKLKDDVAPDYWTPTEGNVKSALVKVLALAQMRPDGIWSGD